MEFARALLFSLYCRYFDFWMNREPARYFSNFFDMAIAVKYSSIYFRLPHSKQNSHPEMTIDYLLADIREFSSINMAFQGAK